MSADFRLPISHELGDLVERLEKINTKLETCDPGDYDNECMYAKNLIKAAVTTLEVADSILQRD